MEFGMLFQFDKSVKEKMSYRTHMSMYFKRYFKNKEYGQGVKGIYIGVFSNDSMPDDEPIENYIEKKYYKRQKQLEYDLFIDYQTIMEGDRIENQAYLIKEVLDSFEPIFIELKIPDFNLSAFKQDFKNAAETISPDFVEIFRDLTLVDADEIFKIFDKHIKEHTVKEVTEDVVVHENNIDEKAEANKEVNCQPITMTADTFWQLINETKRQAGDDQETQLQLLIEALSQLSYQDIGTLHAILEFYLDLLDRRKIITAAVIVNDGFLTDDGFYGFCPWVIGEGETVYKRALTNPDSLADVANPDELADFELLRDVAIEAAQKKHKRDREEYWLTYGQPEEYELSEEQKAECKKGIVFDPELDSKVFRDFDDDDSGAYEAMKQKYFPRLGTKFDIP